MGKQMAQHSYPHSDLYRKASLNFPEDNIPFSRKNENWHLQYAKAVINDYVTNRCAVLYNRRGKIEENRRFADGNNSEELYKDILLEFEEGEMEKKAWTNLDFSIVPIISKFKSVFIGTLGSTKPRITAHAIDKNSIRERDKQKYMLLLRRIKAKDLTPIEEALGIERDPNEYIPETKEELEMVDQLGGLKLNIENAIEKSMKHCFEVSKWSEEIMPQVLADLFENNGAACRDYFDKQTYTVKQRYVDLKNFIAQYSKSPTLDKSRYFGEIVDYTIADLRVATGWDEDKIAKVARQWSGVNGNAYITNFTEISVGDQYGSYDPKLSSYEYDKLNIPVAEIEFASTMYEYDVEKLDENGKKMYFKAEKDRKYNRNDKKSITTPIKVWHKVKLIWGTDYVFDWGLQHDIPRPTFEDARSSFHAVIFRGKSFAERAIPHAKQIQLNILQLQNHVAKAAPGGVAVEWKALEAIVFHGNEVEPMDLLKIRRQTGDLIYSATTARGSINSPASSRPVQELRGTINNGIMVFVNLIEFHISKIREITGVNDLAGTNPNQTATGAQLSVMAKDVSIRQLFIGYISLIKESAINASARLRDLLAYSEKAREIYAPIIGLGTIQVMDIVKDLPAANMNISVDISLNDDDKEKIRQAAMAAMKPGKEGVPVLRFSDYLMIERLLDAGNLILASALIAHKEAKVEEIALARQRENMEISQRGALEQAEAKAKAEENSLKLKSELTKDEKSHEHQLKMEEEKIKHENEMERLRLELQKRQELQPALT